VRQAQKTALDTPAAVVSKGVAEASAASATAEAASLQRINELKSQIENGTYEVDFDRLADKLADEEIARAMSDA
jgi:anti-sigma28 factor (negative regulator of flagellin synthesis)